MAEYDVSQLFALLRSGLQGKPLDEAERSGIDLTQLPKLTALAQKFDVEHLLALGLRQNGFSANQKSILVAALRSQRLQDAQDKICEALEEAGIPFLPLKGAVLRHWYPEPWMRTSCDLDILVHPEDIPKATSVLREQCGCTPAKADSHDVAFHAPNRSYVELHFNLIEQGLVCQADQVLKSVWEAATLKEGSRFHYEMPDALFYCYHVAHLAKHFAIGGCGIRPILDLWILDSLPQADEGERLRLLRQSGLLRFAKAARSVSRAWFDGEIPEPVAAQMQTYILRGGLYCDNENRVAIGRHKEGGRLRYLLKRIFLPFRILKYRYPVLQKHPWLAPLMQLRRWFWLLFGGQFGRVRRDLSYGSSITDKESRETKDFLENIGLLSR